MSTAEDRWNLMETASYASLSHAARLGKRADELVLLSPNGLSFHLALGCSLQASFLSHSQNVDVWPNYGFWDRNLLLSLDSAWPSPAGCASLFIDNLPGNFTQLYPTNYRIWIFRFSTTIWITSFLRTTHTLAKRNSSSDRKLLQCIIIV